MRAISTLSFDDGMSTLGNFARTPFRIRVIMSATGSVMFIGFFLWTPRLPAGLDHSGDLPGQCILAEADAAQLELSEMAPRPTALAAPAVAADSELRCPLGLGNERQLRHFSPLLVSEGHAQVSEEEPRLLVRPGGGH